jgi:hypothetical protein
MGWIYGRLTSRQLDGECLDCFLLVLPKYSAAHRPYFILPFAIDETLAAAYMLRLLLTSEYLYVVWKAKRITYLI